MHPVPPCIFHILPLCEFYYLLICHKGTSVLFLLLLPTPGIPRSSFWQVQVPYTKSQFQRSRSLLGRANTISSLFLLLTPRKSLSVPPLSPCFLALVLSLFLIIYFTSVSYPSNVSMDSSSCWFPPIFSHAFSTTISYLFQPALSLLSPVQPYQI